MAGVGARSATLSHKGGVPTAHPANVHNTQSLILKTIGKWTLDHLDLYLASRPMLPSVLNLSQNRETRNAVKRRGISQKLQGMVGKACKSRMSRSRSRKQRGQDVTALRHDQTCLGIADRLTESDSKVARRFRSGKK